MLQKSTLIQGTIKKEIAIRGGSNLAIFNINPELGLGDYIIIASTPSKRHAFCLAKDISFVLKKELAENSKIIGTSDSGWMIVESAKFLLHIFNEEERVEYDLDSLYKTFN